MNKCVCFMLSMLFLWILVSCGSPILFQKGERIVFLGDSITFQGGYVEGIATYLAAEKADLHLKVYNAGISSETVSGLSEPIHDPARPHLFDRLDSILSKHQPDWVVFMYGINDGIYHPFSEERFQAYKDGVIRFLDEMEARDIQVILLTPPPFAVTDSEKSALKATVVDSYSYIHPYYAYDEAVMQPFRDYILSVQHPAVKKIVDVYEVLDQNKTIAYDDDPIHPNTKGHKLMAEKIIAQLFDK